MMVLRRVSFFFCVFGVWRFIGSSLSFDDYRAPQQTAQTARSQGRRAIAKSPGGASVAQRLDRAVSCEDASKQTIFHGALAA
jgi:hypothetical protein